MKHVIKQQKSFLQNDKKALNSDLLRGKFVFIIRLVVILKNIHHLNSKTNQNRLWMFILTCFPFHAPGKCQQFVECCDWQTTGETQH